jgi:hypothetical protein
MSSVIAGVVDSMMVKCVYFQWPLPNLGADIILLSHISPFVFTQTLLPLLKRTASELNSDVRIINVSVDILSTVTCSSRLHSFRRTCTA